MTAQCLVTLGTTNSRKSKGKSDKGVNSPQDSKDGAFGVHMLVETLYVMVPF